MSDHFCPVEQIKANQSSECPLSTILLYVAYIDDNHSLIFSRLN